MAALYPYLVASLPMLHFPMKPPFSYERFCELCCSFISEKDCQVLRILPLPDQYPDKMKKNPVIRRRADFETALRNELVRVRAQKKHLDPAAYLRPDGSGSSSLVSAVLAATVTPSVLDAEKVLDEMRWKALDELAAGHYFDLDFLITYAAKLLILERWENIRNAEGAVLLEQALQQRKGYA
jgi:hypothetical protein